MLTHIGQHDIIHNGRLGVNKADSVVQNSHAQRQGILELRLIRELLCNILGHHAEDEVNVSDSPLQCHSGFLKKLLRPTTLFILISVIMRNWLCNIWGRKGRRVAFDPYTYMRNWRVLDDSIWTGNVGSMSRNDIDEHVEVGLIVRPAEFPRSA